MYHTPPIVAFGLAVSIGLYTGPALQAGTAPDSISAAQKSPLPEIVHVKASAYCSFLARSASVVLQRLISSDAAISSSAREERKIDLSDPNAANLFGARVSDAAFAVLENSDQVYRELESMRALASETKDPEEQAHLIASVQAGTKVIAAQRYIANRLIDDAESADTATLYLGSDAERALNASNAIPGKYLPDALPTPKSALGAQIPKSIRDALLALGPAEHDLAADIISASKPCPAT